MSNPALFRSACAATKPRAHFTRSIRSRHFSRSSRRLSTPPSSGKDQPSPSQQDGPASSQAESPPKPPSMENLLAETSPENNPLLAPVHIAEDANAILKSDHPATDILTQSGIVVQRQLEMMNILVGFEQANRYVILDPHGNHIGYMAEHDGGIGRAMKRQFLATHRAFTTHVFDRHSREVLRFHRPFSWINSRIRVFDPWAPSSNPAMSSSTSLSTHVDPVDSPQISQLPLSEMRIIGEAHSQWAPLRRKYDLFLSHDLALSEQGPGAMSKIDGEDLSRVQQQQIAASNTTATPSFTQFAAIDERFLSWDFSLLDENSRLIGSVNRSWRGFGREIFTDTGSYVLRMDSAGLEEEASHRHIVSQTHRGEPAYAEALGARDSNYGMTLDQRAVMLATAVTIDYDYFSRHSGGGGYGFLPLWMGGGEAAGGAAGAGAAGAGEAAGAAGAAGAAEAGGAVIGGAGRAVGSAAGGAGVGEGAIAGAGTMAGYEAMQRGMGRGSAAPEDDASPQQRPGEQPYGQPYDPQSPQSGSSGEGQNEDVWGSQESDPWSEGDSGGAGDSGEGGGFLQWLWDQFFH